MAGAGSTDQYISLSEVKRIIPGLPASHKGVNSRMLSYRKTGTIRFKEFPKGNKKEYLYNKDDVAKIAEKVKNYRPIQWIDEGDPNYK